MISLNSVTSTNAYIMIFEMEPSLTPSCQQLQGINSQLAGSKSDGTRQQLTSPFTHTNGMGNKILDTSSASTSNAGSDGASTSKGSPSSSNRSNDTNGQLRNPEPEPTPPAPPLMPPHSSTQTPQPRRSFIGPKLPPGMERSKYVYF